VPSMLHAPSTAHSQEGCEPQCNGDNSAQDNRSTVNFGGQYLGLFYHRRTLQSGVDAGEGRGGRGEGYTSYSTHQRGGL